MTSRKRRPCPTCRGLCPEMMARSGRLGTTAPTCLCRPGPPPASAYSRGLHLTHQPRTLSCSAEDTSLHRRSPQRCQPLSVQFPKLGRGEGEPEHTPGLFWVLATALRRQHLHSQTGRKGEHKEARESKRRYTGPFFFLSCVPPEENHPKDRRGSSPRSSLFNTTSTVLL